MINPEFILKEQLDSIAVEGEILLDHDLLNLPFLTFLLLLKLVNMFVLELPLYLLREILESQCLHRA